MGLNCMPVAVKCLYGQNTASQGHMKHSVYENPDQMFFLFRKTDAVMLSWGFCVFVSVTECRNLQNCS